MILTQTSFDRCVQVYTACAVKKGALYIEELKKGNDCRELFEDARLIIGLTEAIRGFYLSITNCISNEHIGVILKKLSDLCAIPFNKIMNFRNNCLQASQGKRLYSSQGERLCASQD